MASRSSKAAATARLAKPMNTTAITACQTKVASRLRDATTFLLLIIARCPERKSAGPRYFYLLRNHSAHNLYVKNRVRSAATSHSSYDCDGWCDEASPRV